MNPQRLRETTWIAMIVLAAAAVASAADWSAMQTRLPPDANAVVAIDLDKLMKSPVAISERWQEKRAADFAKRPLVVPPGAKRLLIAASVNAQSMEPLWQVSLLEADPMPQMMAIATGQRGYEDKIGGKSAVWSPVSAYFIQLDPKLLAAVHPANRQFAQRWAAAPARETLARYLSDAIKTSDGELVMAIDLQGAVSEASIRNAIMTQRVESISSADVDAAAKLLGGIRGATLAVKFTDKITGNLTVEFSSDAAMLASSGKPLLIEVLSNAGLLIADLQAWQMKPTGNKYVGSGEFTSEGLRRVISLIEPPSPDVAEPAASDSPGTAASRAAEASQTYYRAVGQLIDARTAATNPNSALNATAGFLTRDAKAIDRLPALDVDVDLLRWGAQVSAAFNQAAAVLANGQAQADARRAAVGGMSGSYQATDRGEADARAELRRLEAQRKQVVTEEKAKATEEAMKIINELRASRGEIRAQMVTKYKVEF